MSLCKVDGMTCCVSGDLAHHDTVFDLDGFPKALTLLLKDAKMKRLLRIVNLPDDQRAEIYRAQNGL